MASQMAFGAFLASALVLFPLPWHWRARNVPTLSMLAWLLVSNLTYAINSVIWSKSIDDVVPVWCDIVTKSEVGATAALPACCLSLALQLWRVSSGVHTSHRRTAIISDIILCWGYPVVTMILHYVFQGHRFDIIEDFGCRPTSYVSVPAIVLFYAPIAAVTTKSSFTTRRYVHLMAVTVTLAVWEAVVIGLVFAMTFRSPIGPYTSWADVHYNFSRVDTYPTVLISPEVLFWTYVVWWTIPISGYFFFCAFAISEQAVAEYGPWVRWVTGHREIGKTSVSSPSSTSSEAHLVLPRWKADNVIYIRADFVDTSSSSESSS
ncbi:pheromone A receptor-domain-containing protein [Mycena rosella]|uniref:Pheromone A receptor-domain-containing protein n=1 Tax=Mycena rosella TaxID=1033263 RepID=A0AAD7DGZ0_MYCRO|nr:pheromone A receptor-domain-containing protein [Mycena rosella]